MGVGPFYQELKPVILKALAEPTGPVVVIVAQSQKWLPFIYDVGMPGLAVGVIPSK